MRDRNISLDRAEGRAAALAAEGKTPMRSIPYFL
jgi:hypothetical protein